MTASPPPSLCAHCITCRGEWELGPAFPKSPVSPWTGRRTMPCPARPVRPVQRCRGPARRGRERTRVPKSLARTRVRWHGRESAGRCVRAHCAHARWVDSEGDRPRAARVKQWQRARAQGYVGGCTRTAREGARCPCRHSVRAVRASREAGESGTVAMRAAHPRTLDVRWGWGGGARGAETNRRGKRAYGRGETPGLPALAVHLDFPRSWEGETLPRGWKSKSARPIAGGTRV